MKLNRKSRSVVFLGLLYALVCFLGLTPTIKAHAATILYARTNGLNSGNCSSWATACELSYVLDISAFSGDEVWVAMGMHKPKTTSGFQIDTPVMIYGGFRMTETIRDQRNPELYPTILSGDLAGNDPVDANGVVLDWEDNAATDSDNSEHVVVMNASATLDGFTITAGHGQSAGIPGAGLYVAQTDLSPTLRNLVLRGNHTDHIGGAAFFSETAGPVTVENVDFIGNAAQQGGAVFIMKAATLFQNVLFEENDAVLGEIGLSQWGGAVAGQGGDSSGDTGHPVTMTDVRIINNSAADYAGGMYLHFGVYTIQNASTMGNSGNAVNNAGGLGCAQVNDLKITNALFTGNYGAGIINDGCNMTLTNATISGNYGIGFVEFTPGNLLMRNSIVWGNGFLSFGTPLAGDIRYSIVQYGCPDGATCDHVTNADPAFVTPASPMDTPTTAGDYHLLPSSPAIDAGDNAVTDPPLPATDLDGLARRLDFAGAVDTGNGDPPIVDMGAFEFDGTVPGAFSKTGPVDGAYVSTSPALAWGASSDADGYEYCLDSSDNDACDTSWVSTGALTGADLSGLGSNDAYYWQARAVNLAATTEADGGTWFSFTARIQTFADVPIDHSLWAYIEAFYNAGITTGCGTGPLIFCPDSPVTRASMAVFILRAKYGPSYSPPAATHTFSDLPVAGKEWQEAWVDRLYQEGITTGCGTSPLRYCPENPVTRAAMAIFLLRALEGSSYTPPAASHFFADLPVAGKEWMEPWVDEVYRRGITTGCGMGPLIFCPETAVKRQAMAAFIVRGFGFPLP